MNGSRKAKEPHKTALVPSLFRPSLSVLISILSSRSLISIGHSPCMWSLAFGHELRWYPPTHTHTHRHSSLSPMFHCANSRYLSWPKLWRVSPQLRSPAMLCSENSLLYFVCNSSPGRRLSDQGAYLLHFLSFRNHCSMLSISYCLKIVVLYCV